MTKMRDVLRTTWRRAYTSTITRLPILGAYEQTRASWAKSVESYDAVPDVYKDFFVPLLADGRAFPYAVLTPSYEGFIHRTTEKLVCDLGREVCVLERKGNAFDTQCYPLEGISYVEFRAVLLDSHVKICGVTSRGVPASSTLRFNTVTDYLFTPLLERIRLAGADSKGAPPGLESEEFGHWIRLNYKFMNFARHSLLGGDRVIHAILQPEIRTPVLTLLGRTYYRMISPTHATILTDRELIIIREEARQSGDDRYGGIWDYVPLNKIVTLSLAEKDGDLLALSIQLPESVHLDCLFQASVRREVDYLLERFRELTAR